MIENETYDICILGGGLAGLTLAIQLRQVIPNASVTVIESRAHPVPEAAFKVGESSVEIGAHYFASVIGMADHIEERQLPKLGLRYFMPAGNNSRIEDRFEFGGNVFLDTPSYQLDRGRFENALGEKAVAAGVHFQTQTSVRRIELKSAANGGASTLHTVTVKPKGQDPKLLSAKWVVDASGRAGLLKHKLDLHKDLDHPIHSSWFRVGEKIAVDDWSDDPAWKERMGAKAESRWLSTNHLMGEGYWVWLIHLASGSTSIGIVADKRIHPFDTINSEDASIAWLEKHEPQCAAALQKHRGKLQDFIGLEGIAYSAEKVFTDERWCLTGEAGLFLDPFYSPGSDFIGISNTFVTELIKTDLKGRSITARASLFNELYYTFFHNQLSLYHNQSAGFRHPRIMPLKIIWDFAYYWTIPASFFFHNQLTQLHTYAASEDLLKTANTLNKTMQANFQKWNDILDRDLTNNYFDVTTLEFMRNMNNDLSKEIANEDFMDHLQENIEILQAVFEEMGQLVNAHQGAQKPVEQLHHLRELEGIILKVT